MREATGRCEDKHGQDSRVEPHPAVMHMKESTIHSDNLPCCTHLVQGRKVDVALKPRVHHSLH